MKNTKKIDFIIHYLENEIPAGCRKERPVEKFMNCSIDVPETTKDQLLLIAKHKNIYKENVSYYLYDNKIYERATNMYYCGKHVFMNIKKFIESIEKATPEKDIENALKTKKEYEERFASMIIVGNYFYRETKFPFYKVEKIQSSEVFSQNILSVTKFPNFPDCYSSFRRVFPINEYESAKNYLNALKKFNNHGETRQIDSKFTLYNLDQVPADVFSVEEYNILEDKIFFVWEETSLGFTHTSELMNFNDAKKLFTDDLKKDPKSLYSIKGILLTEDLKQLNKVSLISYQNDTLWIENDYQEFPFNPNDINVILEELKNIKKK